MPVKAAVRTTTNVDLYPIKWSCLTIWNRRNGGRASQANEARTNSSIRPISCTMKSVVRPIFSIACAITLLDASPACLMRLLPKRVEKPAIEDRQPSHRLDALRPQSMKARKTRRMGHHHREAAKPTGRPQEQIEVERKIFIHEVGRGPGDHEGHASHVSRLGDRRTLHIRRDPAGGRRDLSFVFGAPQHMGHGDKSPRARGRRNIPRRLQGRLTV